MLNARKLTPALALITALGLVGAACTDDTLAPRDNQTTPPDTPIGTPPAMSKLVHVAPSCDPLERVCTERGTLGSSSILLQAELVDAQGAPVKNTTIKFEVVQRDPADGEMGLNASNVATDDAGIAKVELFPGGKVGTARIVASTNDPNINSVEYLVSINSKDSADFVVDFTRHGNFLPGKVDVYLFNGATTCAQLYTELGKRRDNDPTTNPNPQIFTAVENKAGQTQADGSLPIVQFPSVANGTSYTVLAYAQSPTTTDVELALGCKDNNPAVAQGMPVRVTVPLVKNLPYMVGDYRVVHKFDLRDGLPPTIRAVVDLLGTLITDPGAFVVGCEAGDANCAVPTAGLTTLIIDFLPDSGALGQLKDAIEGFLGSGFARNIVRNVINDAFRNFINNNAPPWLSTGLNVTADIYETLKSFEVTGVIKIRNQPVYALDEATGLPQLQDGKTLALWQGVSDADKNQQIWEDLYFKWSRGCTPQDPPDCGRRRIGASDLGSGDQFIVGYFNGSVLDGNQLNITQHPLTLNYGALILAVIEKIVLPAIFAPDANGTPVDSIERLLGRVINCDSLAAGVDSGQGAIYNATRGLCNQLLQQAGDGVRSYVTQTLVAQGANNFQIGTPINKGCTLHPPERYQGEWAGKPLPLVDAMGDDVLPTSLCEWEIKLQFGDVNNPSYTSTIDGTFHGSRL